MVKRLLFGVIFASCILIGSAALYVWREIGPVSSVTKPGLFVVPQYRLGFDAAAALEKERYIRHADAFRFLYEMYADHRDIASGGYTLDSHMNTWEIIQKLTASKPDYLWVTVREGLRREQIGEAVRSVLGWSEDGLHAWNSLYTATKTEYREGVYFPDTYLLPRNGSPKEIADRMIARFNEKTADVLPKFAEKNIKWTTGLKIASLIQREAAGTTDMPLISGIIWNRLDRGMPLQIDATIQYIEGKTDGGWWRPVNVADLKRDSPYNTYLHTGLPPTPIASPGMSAIMAALDPRETDCLFYLHDHNREIHCAATYAEHLENIQKYLD
ncbi:endolytic transglycosylase MltG [Patescibacteria group bacterium]|nr:endolytic transglycosylase MltG [Patescibacteria group bacterium]